MFSYATKSEIVAWFIRVYLFLYTYHSIWKGCSIFLRGIQIHSQCVSCYRRHVGTVNNGL